MNITRRRALGLAATLTTLAMFATGCAAGTESGSGKSLSVLIGANAKYGEKYKTWQRDVAETFKEATGADLKFETYAAASDELTTIQTSVVSGQGPDVYHIGTTFTPTAYSTKAFVKLDEAQWEKVGGRDRFVPSSLGISGPDIDNEVGVPFTSRPYVLAYNTEIFAKAGLGKPAETWDGLLAQAKVLTDGQTYGFATGYADNFSPWKFIWTLANQLGNPIVDGNVVRVDDPAVQSAFETYFGWLSKDRVINPAAAGWNDAQAAVDFAAGKSAMLLMTTVNATPTFEEGAVKGKYAFATMPTVAPGQSAPAAEGRDIASIISGDNLAIADYSRNKDLAAEYVKLVTSEEEQLKYNKLFGDLPTNVAAAKKVQSTNPSVAPVLAAGEKSKSTPFTGAWGDIQLALTNIVVQSRQDLTKGGVSEPALKSALEKAQQESQASLDRATGK